MTYSQELFDHINNDCSCHYTLPTRKEKLMHKTFVCLLKKAHFHCACNWVCICLANTKSLMCASRMVILVFNYQLYGLWCWCENRTSESGREVGLPVAGAGGSMTEFSRVWRPAVISSVVVSVIAETTAGESQLNLHLLPMFLESICFVWIK